MVLLALLLGIRQHKILVTRSKFKDINNNLGLKDASDPCNIINQSYSNARIENKICSKTSMSVTGSTFSDYAYTGIGSYGGGIYIYSKTGITLTSNIFERMSAGTAGGAAYISSIATVNLENNTFTDCHSSYGGAVTYYGTTTSFSKSNRYSGDYSDSYGGAIYLDRIIGKTTFYNETFASCYANTDYGGVFGTNKSPDLEFALRNSSFSKCYINRNFGGVFSFYTVKNVIVDWINCDQSKSNTKGGIFYFYDMKGTIELSNMNINYSNTTDMGGVIYLEKSGSLDIKTSIFNNTNSDNGGAIYFNIGSFFSISDCVFENCKSNTDNGGAIFLYHVSPHVSIQRNSFNQCRSTGSGSGIYFDFLTSTVTDDVGIFSSKNTFFDCVSTVSGAFYIGVGHINPSHFVQDNYTGCASNNDGGGFMSKIMTSADFKFTECIFTDCISENSRGGGMGFNLYSEKLLAILIEGCTFEACSALYGSCIGVFYSSSSLPQFTTLKIINYGDIKTSFADIFPYLENYAIFAYVNELSITKADFKNIGSGVITAMSSCKQIILAECNLTNCDSKNYIIECISLDNISISNSVFINCGSCFNIKSGLVEFQSFSIINSIYHEDTTSYITANTTTINDFNMSKHNETFIFYINDIMRFRKGNFIDSDKSIEIDTNGKNIVVDIESLSATNSLMFSVTSGITNFGLSNCYGSYNKINSLNYIVSSNSGSTTLFNCTFESSTIVPLSITGLHGTIDSCNITTDDTSVIFGGEKTIMNNNIRSKNGPAIKILTNGKINILEDTNCIYSPDGTEFLNYDGKLFDVSSGNAISKYQNSEKCKIIYSPSVQFSQSMIFVSSIDFSQSEQFKASEIFSRSEKLSDSLNFKSSSIFSDSNGFIFSQFFSGSNEFHESEIFSQTNKFLTSSKFSESSLFHETGIFTPSELLYVNRSHYFTRTLKFTRTEKFSTTSDFESSNVFSVSGSFSSSNNFFDSPKFSSSVFYSRSSLFKTSIEFNASFEFKPSGAFIGTSNFSRSKEPSPLITYEESNTNKEQPTSQDVSLPSVYNRIHAESSLLMPPTSLINDNVFTSELINVEIHSSIPDITSINHRKENIISSVVESSNFNDADQIELHSSSILDQKIETQTKEIKKHIISSVQIPSSHLVSTTDTRSLFKLAKPTETPIKYDSTSNMEDNEIVITYEGEEFFPEENVAGVKKETQVGMIVGVVVGATCALAICSIIIYCIISRKAKPEDTGSEDLGAEFESETVSMTTTTEYDTSYITQEMPGTGWTQMASMPDEEFFNHDIEEFQQSQ